MDEGDDRERDLWWGGGAMKQSLASESEEVSAQVGHTFLYLVPEC